MANRDNIPRSVVEVVVKMLSCRTKFAGHDEYSCSNSGCKHTKVVTYTCKSRLCSSCGKKGTVAKNYSELQKGYFIVLSA
ncbi:transposase zinc-binding domain-containing protein [Piscirickettsia salmonis]|uniref:transposase zinc-binding domain-containing protein n=1 Tax=Piscirickettsia salmonis TaxID=1238 RepID=UPI00137BE5A2|nr:transposase zinc-binding domain-containing protein [Piscirickettsia salmonis]QHS31625.1 hypothetical protein GW535_02925 [Piscirickettsia salmonis]QHS31630.1 hypothetical protein GW535_02965 [Piscirickettsia salmonis]QIX56450.1 hypothetical protein GW536_14570 [Piscirickettsia salmonis]QIX56455.1 hypothetical protein GW536_14610 [Piscirickettsia salmonis]